MEAAYKPYPDAIQTEQSTNFPSNLYKEPYPHDSPLAAQSEALGKPHPTAQEIAQADKIIAGWHSKPALLGEPMEQFAVDYRNIIRTTAGAEELDILTAAFGT